MTNRSTSEVGEVLGSHPGIHESNVYGVALPHHDGRAGCAAIVFESQLKTLGSSREVIEPSPELLKSVASHSLKNLPKYAVPVFLRITPEMQATGNNKQQKNVLQDEGVDHSKLKKDCNDRLYWLQGGTYVPFLPEDFARLKAGKVRL